MVAVSRIAAVLCMLGCCARVAGGSFKASPVIRCRLCVQAVLFGSRVGVRQHNRCSAALKVTRAGQHLGICVLAMWQGMHRGLAVLLVLLLTWVPTLLCRLDEAWPLSFSCSGAVHTPSS